MKPNREALLLVKNDEVMTGAYEILKAAELSADEKQKEVDKMVGDARAELDKAIDTFMDTAKIRLQELGLSKEGDNLKVDRSGVIFRVDAEGPPFNIGEKLSELFKQ